DPTQLLGPPSQRPPPGHTQMVGPATEFRDTARESPGTTIRPIGTASRTRGSKSAASAGLPAPVNRRTFVLSKPRPQVIIVSEPSAEAAPRVRTSRSTPARSCIAAAHNDTRGTRTHG